VAPEAELEVKVIARIAIAITKFAEMSLVPETMCAIPWIGSGGATHPQQELSHPWGAGIAQLSALACLRIWPATMRR
jgi:hypothetical protein